LFKNDKFYPFTIKDKEGLIWDSFKDFDECLQSVIETNKSILWII
jgi:hypothetical protein